MNYKHYLFILLAWVYASISYAQTETESNNTVATANVLPHNTEMTGSIGCSGDTEDFFKTLTPFDGTLRIYIEATNTSANSGGFYLQTRSKNQSNLNDEYSGSISAGSTQLDTINIYCRAADSIYFRFYNATRCFNYKIRYEIITNGFVQSFDANGNDSFGSAVYFDEGDTIKGAIDYLKPNDNDDNDYFKTFTPRDGTIRIYIERTNTSNTDDRSVYFAVYDKNRNLLASDWHAYVDRGETRIDTMNVYCRAVDTYYFKMYGASSCFRYKIRYEVINNEPQTFDADGNDSFGSAIYFDEGDSIKGAIGYLKPNGNDDNDYFKTFTPRDGTIRIYIERTNTSNIDDRSVYLAVFDKNKNSLASDWHAYVDRGETRIDTMNVYCRAVDTYYFRMSNASSCMRYKIRYEVINNEPQTFDADGNDSFGSAIYFDEGDTIKGAIGYLKANGNDDSDYFKTLTPRNGTIHIYIERTNTSNTNGRSVYLTVYDKNKNSLASDWHAYVNPGVTRIDTMNIYCRAVDTYYFRMSNASSCFRYKIRYEVTLGDDTTIKVCPGFTTDISNIYNTAPYNTVNWTNMGGGAMPPLTDAGEGVYRLTVQNGTQTCTRDTAYVTIGLHPKPDLGNDTVANVCPGFTANLTTFKNTSGLTTQWQGTTIPEAVSAGTYTLIVTNPQGCMDTAVITIGNHPKPNIGNDTVANVCPGFTTDLTTFKNTTGLTTQWQGTTTPEAVGAGVYTLIVTNPQGCMDTAVITIGNHPKPNLGNDTTANVCPGFTADLTTFKNISGLTTQWQGTTTPEAVGAGVYTLIVTNPQGCMDTAQITINNHPKPDLGNDTVANVCPGFTADLTTFKNTSGLTTQWQGTTTPEAVSAGTYTLIVTNPQGCMDSAVITINNHPKPNLGNDTVANVCPGFTADLTTFKNTSGLTTQWQGTTTPEAVGVGMYTLIVTNPQGCMDTAQITINNHPKPNLGNDTVANVCPGFTADLTTFKNTSGLTTQWQGTTTPEAVGVGMYTLIVTNPQGCMDTAQITINNSLPPNLGADITEFAWVGQTVNFVDIKDTTGFSANGWNATWESNVNGSSGNTIVEMTMKDTVYATLRVESENGCADTMSINIYPANSIVAASGAANYSANVEVTGSDGWTNYYFDNSTPDKSDDILLLSLKKNGNDIGTVNMLPFNIAIGATLNAGSNVGTEITNPIITNTTGFYSMNRYWNVTPTTQPNSVVGIRFYFNTQDFNDVNGSYSGVKSIQDLVMYHLIDGNPNPTTNWAGATMAPESYLNGAIADNTTWVYTNLDNDKHQAEFNVNSFSGGGAGLTGNNMPLPINIKLSAKPDGFNSQLIWSMVKDETTYSGITIERSTDDGKTFESINKVNIRENSYTDADVSKINNRLFYRLLITGNDGTQQYSNIAVVQFSNVEEVILSPNPAKEVIRITGINHYGLLRVIDASGRIVQTFTLHNEYEKTIAIGDIPSGTYTIQLIGNSETKSIKFVKQQ